MDPLKASEFKAKCLSILDHIDQTGDTVTILKRGRPVARLVPAAPASSRYPQEDLVGTVEVVGDIISPVVRATAWHATRRTRA